MAYTVEVDPQRGGRWVSLRDPHGREWLWSRPDPARAAVVPGDQFVDVGGFEECLPTIGGHPDHGDVWTRAWHPDGDALSVETETFRLQRRLVANTEAVTADYRLEAIPGYRFIWAGHALLNLAIGARIQAPEGNPTRIWPGHVRAREGTWPSPLGIPFNELHHDDGSATFAALLDLTEVTARDEDGGLRFRLYAHEQPQSMGLWRNLGGYPWNGNPTYRNVGIEPILGREFNIATAEEDDVAIVPPSGAMEWRLVIDAV